MQPPISRRDALVLAAGLATSSRLTAAERPTVVVDTHLHCFAGPDDRRFPYHKDGPYTPAEAATPDHLLKCMDGAGVDFAVVVHPEPIRTTTVTSSIAWRSARAG